MVAPLQPDAAVLPVQVLLVDDHPIVRQGVSLLIEQQNDLSVCAEVETVTEALEAVKQVAPDVAVVDLMLERGSGLDLIQTLHQQLPQLPVLVLSMHEERLYAERVLRAGARGYVMKRETPDRILCAIRQVCRGELVFSDGLLGKLNLQPNGAASNDALELAVAKLSDRELEVFQFLRQGYSRRQTAEALQRDAETIDAYCANLLMKLGLEDLTELAAYALNPIQDTVPMSNPDAPAGCYCFEAYVIDTSRQELLRNDVHIPLEPKVYQVLLYLVQHADRLVTREELLNTIWANTFVQDAVLTRCVREVRHALGDDRATQGMIQTRLGQGYRFVATVIRRDRRGQPQ